MTKRKGFKPPAPTQSKRFSLPSVSMPAYDYPIFCFKHLHRDFHLDQCDAEEKKSFIEQIVRMSRMTWNDLKLAPRHGMGSEKISVSALKAKSPPFITEDVQDLLAFRFQGKKPFVGHRDGFIFHVLFIDRAFSLYPH
jgi:hypothetical protein